MLRWLLLVLSVLGLNELSAEDNPYFVGYFTNWAQYRPGAGSCKPSNIAPIIPKLTHLNYAFLLFNYPNKDGTIQYLEWDDASFIQEFNGMKGATNLLVSIGGWNFNDPSSSYGSQTYTYFSNMVADANLTKTFIDSAFSFCSQNKLEGIDLDWEFPGVSTRGGTSSDYQNYLNFMQTFRNAITSQGSSLVVTAAFPAMAPTGFVGGFYTFNGKSYEVNINDPNSYLTWLACLSTYFDFCNIMCYDYYGIWSSPTNENAPLFPLKEKGYSVSTTINQLVSAGMAKEKMVIGVPSYGRTFSGVDFPSSLENQPYGPGCSFTGPGTAGYYSKQDGILAYYEIIGGMESPTFDTNTQYIGTQYQGVLINPITGTTYAWNEPYSSWVSYDTAEMAGNKGLFIASQKLKGAMIYPLDFDNFMDPIAPFAITNNLYAGLMHGTTLMANCTVCGNK